MTTTPEGKVKAKIKRWLKDRGFWYCMPIGTGFGTQGVPDFIACVHGYLLGIEAKAPGKRSSTTQLQRNQLAAIRAGSGFAIVVDDIEQLTAWYEETCKEQEWNKT